MHPSGNWLKRSCLLIGMVACTALIGCGTELGEAAFQHTVEAGDPSVTVDRACIDFWSLVHFGSGYYLGERFEEEGLAESMLLIVWYEWLEPAFWPAFDENRLNQECDLVVGGLGWLAWYLNETE
jgi:hypothetical protein